MLLGFRLCIGIAGRDLIHRFTELHLAEQEDASTTAHAGLAVVGRFARHISEVDTFTEGVAVDGGFGGCDTEAL